MSTRIIIEKDGERYVANDLIPKFVNDGKPFCITNKETDEYVSSTFTKLPPVIRTDNSEVIANLEAENAKLREALKPIMEIDTSPVMWPFLRVGKYNVYRAVRDAQDVINGISRKDEDISRKGEKK